MFWLLDFLLVELFFFIAITALDANDIDNYPVIQSRNCLLFFLLRNIRIFGETTRAQSAVGF